MAQSVTLRCLGWGALSVPRKNLVQVLVAAASTACRCSSLFRIGKQKAWGRRPPCHISMHSLSFDCSAFASKCTDVHRHSNRQCRLERDSALGRNSADKTHTDHQAGRRTGTPAMSSKVAVQSGHSQTQASDTASIGQSTQYKHCTYVLRTTAC